MFLDTASQQDSLVAWNGPSSRRRNSSYGNRGEVVDEADQQKETPADYHITTESLPGSLSKVPFVWQLGDQKYRMEFLAGFTGFTQDPGSLQVRPKIGWAVREMGE